LSGPGSLPKPVIARNPSFLPEPDFGGFMTVISRDLFRAIYVHAG